MRLSLHSCSFSLLLLCLQGAAGEDYVSRVFGSAIGRPINAGIKYYKRQDWLEGEGKVHALWESQGSHTPTDPEVWLGRM